MPSTSLSHLLLQPHSHAVCCQTWLSDAVLTPHYLAALGSLQFFGIYNHRALWGQSRAGTEVLVPRSHGFLHALPGWWQTQLSLLTLVYRIPVHIVFCSHVRQ